MEMKGSLKLLTICPHVTSAKKIGGAVVKPETVAEEYLRIDVREGHGDLERK